MPATILGHQLGVLQFTSNLRLSLQRQAQIPQVKPSVPTRLLLSLDFRYELKTQVITGVSDQQVIDWMFQ